MSKNYLNVLILAITLCGFISDDKAMQSLEELEQARRSAAVSFKHHSYFDLDRPGLPSAFLSFLFDADPRIKVQAMLQSALKNLQDQEFFAYFDDLKAIDKFVDEMVPLLESPATLEKVRKATDRQDDYGYDRFLSYLTPLRRVTFHWYADGSSRAMRALQSDYRNKWGLTALQETLASLKYDLVVLKLMQKYYPYQDKE